MAGESPRLDSKALLGGGLKIPPSGVSLASASGGNRTHNIPGKNRTLFLLSYKGIGGQLRNRTPLDGIGTHRAPRTSPISGT